MKHEQPAPEFATAPHQGAEGTQPGRNRSHIWVGLFILAVGAVLLLRQTGVLFPHWLFTWPVLLIGFSLIGALKEGFRPGGWIPLGLVGAVFLVDKLYPHIHVQRFAWPVLIMTAGLWIILKPRSKSHWNACTKHGSSVNTLPREADETDASADPSDYVDITSVFGGVKKIVLSKNFRGGEIVNVMGGSEVNLTKADFRNRVVVECTNIFGGTKLIVPPTWDVQNEVVAIFGGVDDKRQITGDLARPEKVILLQGTCLFGGIDIRSY
ncbi:MAG TPA: DUF5668 domain-containing protein [Chitinophagaceae bacterium]|nr:DUF5668 domain-containing protein [Chitinophagaceae bacterium]